MRQPYHRGQTEVCPGTAGPSPWLGCRAEDSGGKEVRLVVWVTRAPRGARFFFLRPEPPNLRLPRLRVAGDPGRVHSLGGGVLGKGLLVLDEDSAHDAGIIRPARTHDKIRNDIDLLVRVGEREKRLRKSIVGEFLVSALGSVFDRVGQEFQLVDQVREFWRVDLSEFHLPKRQMP